MTGDRILVVDDDDDVRGSIAELLDELGYVVLTAVDAIGALTLVAAGARPDVIVLDLMMPKSAGRELLRRQQVDPRLHHIPVIALTAGGRSAGVVDELGVEALLGKPFDRDVLVALIEQARAT